MILVVDASALAGWLLPDESGPDLGALARDPAVELAAPWLLWAELRNILVVNERRGRLPAGLAEQVLEAVEGLGLRLDGAPSSAATLSLARRRGLTVCDALYLELALRDGARIATRDGALAAAAQAEGVRVIA